jgi:hypothetical protein
MTILSALRERLSGPDASAESRSVGDAQRDPVEEARVPFAGYDRLDERQVVHGLSDHSQIELEAIESYERSHESRQPVLDKLRWMRGREPLPGYDARGVEEIVAALEDADLGTLWKVRAYERKFANRPAVLEAVVRVHHRRVAVRPPSAARAYQSASATAAASATPASRAPLDRPEVDHAERNGRP